MCEHLGHCVIAESDSGDRYRTGGVFAGRASSMVHERG